MLWKLQEQYPEGLAFKDDLWGAVLTIATMEAGTLAAAKRYVL